MLPKLLAFDLDGTLLTSEKKLSDANKAALQDMVQCGSIVALASGRLGSSMMQYHDLLGIDLAMLTLNGAAVYTSAVDKARQVYNAPLGNEFARELIEYSAGKPFLLNFYVDDYLYCVGNDLNQEWVDLYYAQTRTPHDKVADLGELATQSPSKIIFVGAPETLNPIQEEFRERWDGKAYVCRTWDYYLEFLSLEANKAKGLHALAKAFNLDISQTAAFGDAENDLPMIEASGLGVAMKNASDSVKDCADRVSEWTNDEDGVAREWERLKFLEG